VLTEFRPRPHGAAISVSDHTLDVLLEIRTWRRFSWDWPIDRSPTHRTDQNSSSFF